MLICGYLHVYRPRLRQKMLICGYLHVYRPRLWQKMLICGCVYIAGYYRSVRLWHTVTFMATVAGRMCSFMAVRTDITPSAGFVKGSSPVCYKRTRQKRYFYNTPGQKYLSLTYLTQIADSKCLWAVLCETISVSVQISATRYSLFLPKYGTKLFFLFDFPLKFNALVSFNAIKNDGVMIKFTKIEINKWQW